MGNIEINSNNPDEKFEEIKKLIDKGGSLKDGIKDDKGNLSIFMEKGKIIGLDEVYDLNIIRKTFFGNVNLDIQDININQSNITIETNQGKGEIPKEDFLNAVKGGIKNGFYSTDINDKHIEFKRIAKINKPNPKIIEANKQGKTAEVQGDSESQRQALLDEVQKQGINLKEIKGAELISTTGSAIEGIEKQMSMFEKIGEKISGIFDGLMKGFDLIFEGKFKEGLAAIMAGFRGEKEKTEETSQVNASNNKNNINESKIEKRGKESFISLFLTKTYEGKDKLEKENLIMIPSIIESQVIQSKKFTDLIDLQKKFTNKNNGIAKEIGSNNTDSGVYYAIDTIITKENLINNLIGKQNPDWKNLSISEINTLIGPHLIKLSKLNKIESLDDLEKINLSLNINKETGKIEGELVDSEILSKNKEILTPDFILKIKSTYKDVHGKDNIETLRENLLNDKQIDFLKETNALGEGIQKDLSNTSNFKEFNLSLGEEFKNHFEKSPIGLSDSFDLLLITGGKRLENLNSIEKSMFYIKIFKILHSKNPEFAGKYGSALTKEVYKDNSNLIPKDVQNTIKTLSASLGDIALGVLQKEFEFILGIVKENPAASAAVTAVMATIMFFGGRVLIAKSLSIAIIIASLSALGISKEIISAIEKHSGQS